MLRRTCLAATGALVLLAACATPSPQPTNLVDTLAGNPNFSTMSRLINQAGLADSLRAPGPFTVFAPTDAAFKAVPEKTLADLAANREQLRAVLGYHVVPGAFASGEVKPGNVKTLQGADVPLSRTAGFVGVDQALVTQADIRATNGIVHAIDQVLMPPRR